MPPRKVKRGGAAKRSKAAHENNDNNNKQQQEPETAEAVVNHEDEENAVNEEKSVVVVEEKPDDVKNNEEEVKESIDEYEKEEHLDFEDNYPEYEPLEYGGDDYDENENEQDEDQEVGDEVEEEQEGNMGEEEGDTGDEEVEYVYEEVEVDEDEEHADEDHDPAQMGDVEEEKHSEVVKERQKQREFEVFVGGLDKDATEDDLRKVFSEVGVITEVRLVLNPQTKKNRGFAFLRYETVEQAKRAVAELKNPVINGKQCRVSPVHDNDTLYLGTICKTWKKEALKDKLKHYGVENVENLTLEEDSNTVGMNRGFAFLEFPSRSEAMKAYKQLQKRDVMFGVDKPAEVSFTNSVVDPVDEIMAQVKTVFIDSLPPSWDEGYVRDLLKKYGEIEKIELARNMPAARRKNYGFVTFGTHAAAVECANSITSAGLGEGDKKAKVRARLSRPLGKGSRKHVSNGAYRPGRNSGRSAGPSRSRLTPRNLPACTVKRTGSRVPPVRPLRVRDRCPGMSMSVRARPAAHAARSSDKRSTAPGYSKSSMKRDYGRREDLPPPRSRVSVDYGSRVTSQRHPSYRDYPAHGSGYSELHKSTSRAAAAAPRRGYVDDDYGQRFDRPLPPSHLSHREVRSHDYDSLSGSKRPYAVIDDVPPRYADTGARQSRSRLDYEYGGSTSQYGDAYGDRLGRSSLGYNGSRSSISTHDSHGMYGSRQSMSYSRGSFGGSDGGLYSSSYGPDYISRGSDVGGRSYSSMYSGRGVGSSNSYMSGGRSGSYY